MNEQTAKQLQKHLYLIGGTMGVGKTTTCRILKEKLDRSVFLDGDWCWDMHPFTVNFYLGDRMVPFECYSHDEGFVYMGEDALPVFNELFGKEYTIEEVYNSHHRSCDDKRNNILYRFERRINSESNE